MLAVLWKACRGFGRDASKQAQHPLASASRMRVAAQPGVASRLGCRKGVSCAVARCICVRESEVSFLRLDTEAMPGLTPAELLRNGVVRSQQPLRVGLRASALARRFCRAAFRVGAEAVSAPRGHFTAATPSVSARVVEGFLPQR